MMRSEEDELELAVAREMRAKIEVQLQAREISEMVRDRGVNTHCILFHQELVRLMHLVNEFLP